MKYLLSVALLVVICEGTRAEQPIGVWPGLAPGESTRQTGQRLPFIQTEVPPVTRVVDITYPTFTVHRPSQPNGVGAVILPGGGFSKVVPDKEGTEAAQWLNQLGVTAFVLSYRTTPDKDEPGWVRPLQDAQRTMSTVRANAHSWGLRTDAIGLVGFSAGGQIAARLLSSDGKLTYQRIDEIDDQSHRPDFAALVYPWNIYDVQSDDLIDGVRVNQSCPPTFLVHTHDDRSSSLGAVLFYAGLKRHSILSELHVYANGGHGYGLRPVEGSQIASWTGHAAHFIKMLSTAND